MHREHDPKRQLVFGILITALGVLFLLDQFGIIAAGYVFKYFWPLVLIGLGVSRLIRINRPHWKFDADHGRQTGGPR